MAIDAQSLMRLRPQKHPTLLPWGCPRGGRPDMGLVTGQAGDGASLRLLSERVKGRHVPGLAGTGTVYQSNVRVIHVFRNAP